ncbi:MULTISPECIES: hypothetical protein [unclassified Anaeromyxobacter]|uniref:hypothetical protein n=1 Tax=unclassified Anaeromyxobacter TaxID=2620896 RepID=UPI001F573836|nr:MULTISPECIES: hypothetical protein [unclassified Anaeromyxobacter]
MTRRIATLLWAALLVLPVAFLGVAVTRARGASPGGHAALLLWLAVVASAFNVALSRVVPPRLEAARRGGRDAVTLTRFLVAWALCEAAALCPLVAYLVTRDPRLVVVLLLDLAALAFLYPSDRRWDRLAPAGPGGAALGPRREAR